MENEKIPFMCMSEHQTTFNALKMVPMKVPDLWYPYFFREFILEADALNKGLDALLSR